MGVFLSDIPINIQLLSEILQRKTPLLSPDWEKLYIFCHDFKISVAF